MGDATLLQSSFLGGCWSQTMQGRIDRPDYRTSLNVCLNSLPLETGAWTRRPGTKLGSHLRGGLAGRGITWSFKENSPYTIELTNGFIRFHAGPRLATTNDAQTVAAISSANPAVVQTGTHGWTTGDTVFFTALGTPDPLLLNRQFVITVVDTTHFSIVGAITGNTIDGSTLQAFTTGTIARIAELQSAYTDPLWPSVRMVQAEQTAVLLQGSITPYELTATANPSSTADATFSIAPAQFADGPYLDPAVGATLTPASVSGIVAFAMTSPTYSSSAAYNTGDFVIFSAVCYQSLIDQNTNLQPDTHPFAWAVVPQDRVVGASGLQPTDIGRHIRLLSEPAAWASGTTYAAGTPVKYNFGYWISVVGSNLGNVPGADINKWTIATNASRWTWGKITGLTGATETQIPQSQGTIISFGTATGFDAYAFDGITASHLFQSAQGHTGTQDIAIGKNFTGSAQAVSYALVYSSADVYGFMAGVAGVPPKLTFNLRAKATAPASASDGTLLGTVSGVTPTPNAVIQILSSDAATTFNYIWVEVTYTGSPNGLIVVSEIKFFQVGASTVGITVQIIGPALLYTTAINTWRLGLFTSATGYPKCGTYHEGRLWLSGLVSNRVDASALVDIFGGQAPTHFYFTPTVLDGTVTDACAISYTLDGPDVNAVFWMEPDHQGIIAGTQAGEWLISASALNSPLTPINMQAHRVTKIGCANIEPRRTDHTLTFVQKDKHKIMEYFADIFSGKFSAPNLTLTAAHLSTRGLEELAYQNGTTPILWARCTDGTLIGASYKRDSLMQSQGPTFAAWHNHILGSGRVIENISVGPSAIDATTPPGLLDTLSMVTNDTVTNIRHIVFLTNLFEEIDPETSAWFLDDAIAPTVIRDVTVGGRLGVNLYGLWPLNGKTCTAFLAGVDCGEFAISNGAMFVPYGANVLFTQALANSVTPMPAVVGFTYNSDGQIVRPATPQESGARSGPALGKKRRAHQYAAQVVNASKISFGTSFATGRLKPANFLTPGNNPYAENQMFNGVHWDSLQDDYSFDGMLCWRCSRPYPATIAAISLFVQTQDK